MASNLKKPYNLQTFRPQEKNIHLYCLYLLTVILDAQEIPTKTTPQKKKQRNGIPWYPRLVSRRNLDANFRTSSVNPSRQGPHPSRVPRVSIGSQKCHEFLWQRSFKHRAFFLKQRNFLFILQVKVYNQYKVRWCWACILLFFWKDRQLRLGKHSEKNIQLHLEKWTRLIC